MTFSSSKLKYCVQKTTIQRDVGLRIYYFAYMNSPPHFRVPSILRCCYSNYELINDILYYGYIFTGISHSLSENY